MGYVVIHYFTDLQDNNHPYKVGDKFPRLGKDVSEERLKELSGAFNKQRKPLIKFVEDKPVSSEEEKKTYKKSDIFRMSMAELQELAASEGIKNAKEITGSELKTILVKHFNL